MERCDLCDQFFGDQQALRQHTRDSIAHAVSFRCQSCNRSFVNQNSLDQHLQNSPAHDGSFECEQCNKSFGSQGALDQHSRDSPAHARSYDCEPCSRSFGGQSALNDHIQYSPAHAISFYCELCNRTFGSQSALDQHIQYSPAHVAPPVTPLDAFFQSFPGFGYDPDLPPSESFARLKKFHDWGKNDPDDKKAWDRYQSALEEEVRIWFGSEDDLSAWNSICRAIGIQPLPATCAQGVRSIRGVFVNIIDLIDWARSGKEDNRVQRFPSLEELREYTRRTGKVFHSRLDRDDDGNVVLRHLLRFIFRGTSNAFYFHGH